MAKPTTRTRKRVKRSVVDGIAHINATFNNTVIMIVFSTVYFALGWAVGFLYVTPLFVFAYTAWFRVNLLKAAFLAAVATVIVYGFIVFLLMPFDQGAIVFTEGL